MLTTNYGKYLYSVIINVKDLKTSFKSLDSIFNQSLNFEEYAQIIIWDSADNDLITSLSYVEEYPDNFLILSKKNLEYENQIYDYIKGQYVIFLNENDYLSNDTFENVKCFINNNDEINLISIQDSSVSDGEYDLFSQFEDIPEDGLIIDMNTHDLIQDSLNSTFIKSDLLKNIDIDFNEVSNYNYGTLLINKLLIMEKRLGLLNTCKYHKQSSSEYVSLDPLSFEKEFFISKLDDCYLDLINYCKQSIAKIPDFIQNLIIYKLSYFIKNKYQFLDAECEELLFNKLQEILSNIDDEKILSSKLIEPSIISFLIYLKNGKKSKLELTNNQLLFKSENYQIDKLNYHPIYILSKKIDNKVLTIRGMLNSHFNNDYINFEALVEDDEGNTEIIPAVTYDLNNIESNVSTYLNIDWEYKNIFEVRINCENLNGKITFNVKYDDDSNKLEYTPLIRYAYKSGITEENNNLYYKTKQFKFSEHDIQITTRCIFSIIMAIYNTGHYLNQTIDSVINQTISFEDHVQLILVNDGSQDNSLEICKEYQQLYPQNIVVIDQENGGQSSARNHGLEYAEGEYVNFLDSDDYLSENALEEVLSFIDKYGNKTDIIALPIIPFGRYSHNHKLHYKFEKTRLIDLNKEPNNPHLHVSSSFIKRETLGDIRFDTRLISSEDAHLVNLVLLNKKTLGVISTASYFYRKRFDESSTIDTMSFKKEYYTDRLKYHFVELINHCKQTEGYVPKFIQYVLAYDLQWLVKETETLDMFENDFERKEFIYYIKEIVNSFDDEVIWNNRNISDYSLKTFFYYLKKQDEHYEITKNNVLLKVENRKIDDLACHLLWIDLVKIHNGFLYISGFFNSLINYDRTSIVAIKENEDETLEYYPGKQVNYTSRKNMKYLDKNWQYKKNFDIKIPLENAVNSKIQLVTNFHKNGDNNDFRKDNLKNINLNIKFNKHSKFSATAGFLVKEPYIISFEDKTFTIHEYSYKKLSSLDEEFRNKLEKEKPYGYEEAIKVRKLYTRLYPIVSRLKRNKEIYLFIDRKEIADDNSMHLFKYANSVKDNVKKYLVVSNKSRNYKTLSKIGNVVNYDSLKHKLVYLFADKIISTHPYESELNPFFEYGDDRRELFNGLNVANTYFLQHGVTLGNISDWMSKCDKDLSLIVTVSDMERESFFVDGYNFDKDIIETLGFPRYDNLKKDDTKKQILIIPTWRKFLSGQKELFLHSEYYKKINSLINNEELLKYAKENDYKIVFKGHPELEKPFNDEGEKFIDFINIPEQITLSTQDSYQQLFNNSSVLITDYSSVFFDFAYLKKPVIYYQPDEDYHYAESYFDFETMGFGDVIKDETTLISKIREFMENDAQMDQKYRERVDNFFKFTDQNNSQRVYNWIKEH